MIIAWFSCGVTSAVACKLAVDRFGADRVDLYYIDIRTQHSDNDRFIKDCERWIGKSINRVARSKYQDQFEVWLKERYINGIDGAKCSTVLKKEVRFWLEQSLMPNLFEPNRKPWTNQVFGFEFERNEINRAIDFKKDYQYTNPLFPLIDAKLTKNDCAGMVTSAGIELPAMYRLGYSNNNCIGCTKGGKGYWNKIRVDFPEVFAKAAKTERAVGHSCINGTFLDELDPEDGKTPTPVVPECSIVCEEILSGDFQWKAVDRILNGEIAIENV